MTTWALPFQQINPPKNPAALLDVLPLLERLVSAFGIRPLAQLLGVEPGTVSNWRAGRRVMSEEMVKRLLDLHDVLVRALRVFHANTAMRWLVGNEPLLGGNRPLDVLALHGAAPLIEALEGIEAGAYA